MLVDVVEVKYISDHKLFLRFEDGKHGIVDIATLIIFDGIFVPLKDPVYFSKVFLNPELGTICWSNGADIAPEVLYHSLSA